MKVLMVFVLISMSILAGCSTDDERNESLASESIGGFSLRQAFTTGQLKELKRIKGLSYYKLENGIIIALTNEKLIEKIELTIDSDGDLSTQKGLKINNSNTIVKKVYGNPTYKKMEQGAKIFGYHDKSHSTALEFWFVDEKVNMIRLFKKD